MSDNPYKQPGIVFQAQVMDYFTFDEHIPKDSGMIYQILKIVALKYFEIFKYSVIIEIKE